MRTQPYVSVTAADVNLGVVTALLDEDHHVYGVVGIDITLGTLARYIEGVHVGRNGWAIVVDTDGTVLTTRNHQARFKNIAAIDDQHLPIMLEKDAGYTIFSKDGQQYCCFFFTSPALDWKLAFIFPVEEIEGAVWGFVNQVLLALVVALMLLSSLTLLGLHKFVIQPVRHLNHGTKLIAQTGNLEHRIELPSQDELGNLADSFNTMRQAISDAESALKASEKELKKHHDHLEELVEERTAMIFWIFLKSRPGNWILKRPILTWTR
jgi:methyl-accepting chemotaxis protein